MDTAKKTLNEVLEKYGNNDVFIGSGSGFFYIGQAALFASKVPSIDTNNINVKKREIAVLEKKLQEAKAYVENYVSVIDRKVMSEFPKALGGTAIKISGNEVGKIWLKEEVKNMEVENGKN